MENTGQASEPEGFFAARDFLLFIYVFIYINTQHTHRQAVPNESKANLVQLMTLPNTLDLLILLLLCTGSYQSIKLLLTGVIVIDFK